MTKRLCDATKTRFLYISCIASDEYCWPHRRFRNLLRPMKIHANESLCVVAYSSRAKDSITNSFDYFYETHDSSIRVLLSIENCKIWLCSDANKSKWLRLRLQNPKPNGEEQRSHKHNAIPIRETEQAGEKDGRINFEVSLSRSICAMCIRIPVTKCGKRGTHGTAARWHLITNLLTRCTERLASATERRNSKSESNEKEWMPS